MRTHAQRHIVKHRHAIKKVPAVILPGPRLGEDMELFSDRLEDAVEYEVIMHDFTSRHDAELEAESYA